jgi:hypothetical protein
MIRQNGSARDSAFDLVITRRPIAAGKAGNGAGSSTHVGYAARTIFNSEAIMNETTVSRMIAARTQLKQEEQMIRSIALHKYHRGLERRRQNKIAGSMLVLIALVIANAWAAGIGWGLQ